MPKTHPERHTPAVATAATTQCAPPHISQKAKQPKTAGQTSPATLGRFAHQKPTPARVPPICRSDSRHYMTADTPAVAIRRAKNRKRQKPPPKVTPTCRSDGRHHLVSVKPGPYPKPTQKAQTPLNMSPAARRDGNRHPTDAMLTRVGATDKNRQQIWGPNQRGPNICSQRHQRGGPM